MHIAHTKSDFSTELNISKLPMVYVLSTDDFKYIKIGQTKTPGQRFINIQSGCPFKLFLWLGIRTPKAKYVEKTLHEKFEHRRLHGEWFSLSDGELDELSRLFLTTNCHIREVRNALLQA